MLDLYTTLKFVHVLAAIAWLGGGILLDMMISQARRSGNQPEMLALLAKAERYGKTFFSPSAVIVLVAGIGMASIGGIMSAPWVSFGFLGVFVSAGLGMGYLTPRSGALRRMIEARGMQDADVRALGSRLLMVSRIDLLLLVLVVAAMVFKPGAH